MNEVWFTADHHFGHKRIIELSGLPDAPDYCWADEFVRRVYRAAVCEVR